MSDIKSMTQSPKQVVGVEVMDLDAFEVVKEKQKLERWKFETLRRLSHELNEMRLSLQEDETNPANLEMARQRLSDLQEWVDSQRS